MEIEVIESGSGMIECMWMGGRWEDCEQRLFRGLSPLGAGGLRSSDTNIPIYMYLSMYSTIQQLYPQTK